MKFTLIYLILLFSVRGHAQDPTEMMKEGSHYEATLRDADALNKYRDVLRIQPQNITALCRCSELCSRMANRIKNKLTRDDYYAAAKTYAETALHLNPKSGDANFVMSVVTGRMALTKTGKDKIICAKEIKKYADLAIEYDPNNYKAWHVLGKWYYEVSNLNSFEKFGIKLFYGGMPKASFKDAIIAYEKSRELAPYFMLNYLELARTYHKNDQDEKAIALLKMIPSMPNRTEDDVNIREQARKMLIELQ